MAMIASHMHAIREHPMTKHAFVYIYFEANLSMVSANMFAAYFRNCAYGPLDVVQFKHGGETSFGTWTTNQSKERMVNDTQRLLSDGSVRFARTMIGKRGQENKMRLLEQLRVFRKVPVTHNSEFHEDRFEYTGKSRGCPDDLAFDFCNTASQMIMKRTSASHLAKARERGWIRI